jgi:hypothetical protein
MFKVSEKVLVKTSQGWWPGRIKRQVGNGQYLVYLFKLKGRKRPRPFAYNCSHVVRASEIKSLEQRLSFG